MKMGTEVTTLTHGAVEAAVAAMEAEIDRIELTHRPGEIERDEDLARQAAMQVVRIALMAALAHDRLVMIREVAQTTTA